MCVCVCVSVYMRACVHASVHVGVRAYVNEIIPTGFQSPSHTMDCHLELIVYQITCMLVVH